MNPKGVERSSGQKKCHGLARGYLLFPGLKTRGFGKI
jgi:hypothetical protein